MAVSMKIVMAKKTTPKKAEKPKIVPPVTPTAPVVPAAVQPKGKEASKTVLYNTLGEEVDERDYFFSTGSEEEKERGSIIPTYFTRVCGKPVDREDLITVFNKFFDPKDGYLFYKCGKKEVYTVIVPIRDSRVNDENDATSGECQRHSMSFIKEGSVDEEMLRSKLQMIVRATGYEKSR